MTNALRKALALSAFAACAGLTVVAHGHELSTGTGDGSVTLGVDGYGAFGSSVGGEAADADYDPVGAIGPAGTTFESGVAFRLGNSGARQYLTAGDIGGGGLPEVPVTGNSTTANSSFTIGSLSFTLTQTVQNLTGTGGERLGSILVQSYSITNTGSSAADFEMVRYIDGDLLFDGSLVDGGGRIGSGADQILFETDSATGNSEETTFLGIRASGGTRPSTGGFEIDEFSELRERIADGVGLDDQITGDSGDADQFVDPGQGYDITLALLNVFSLGAGESATYTTETIFGTGAPDEVPVELIVTPSSEQIEADLGEVVTFDFDTLNAEGDVVWALISGALGDAAVDADGTFTWSTAGTAEGTYTFTVQATDASGDSDTGTLTVVLGGGPGPNPIPLPAAAWMGLSTLGGLGLYGKVRARRRK